MSCHFCRAFKSNTVCAAMPCACFCHSNERAAALAAERANVAHFATVLKNLREAYGVVVPAIIRGYIEMTPAGHSRELAKGVLHAVEKVGRQIDDALIAVADSKPLKERAELQRQLAEACTTAQTQADALAEQAEEVERLRRRLSVELQKAIAMNRALAAVWDQVPDRDRIGQPTPQWVLGLGRRVRALTAALPRGCACGDAEHHP